MKEHQTKVLKLSEITGYVLQLAREALSREDNLSACGSSGYTLRYCEFFICLHKLMVDSSLKRNGALIDHHNKHAKSRETCFKNTLLSSKSLEKRETCL